MESVHELTRRGHARTNYDPEEFIEAMDTIEDPEQRAKIRETFRNIDGGRFYDFLDEAHNVLSKSDLKRREEFVRNYSPHLVQWIRAFGAVEDLNRFPNLEADATGPDPGPYHP